MEWPRRFIYVYSASQGMVVAAKPLIDAGRSRVARIVQFIGAATGERQNTRDQREAAGPARQFSDWVANTFGSHPPKIDPRHGDAQVIEDWVKHALEVCSQGSDELPVVMNITGGTTPMKLGMLTVRSPHRRLVLVHGSPLRTEFIVDRNQFVAPTHGELSLAEYLGLYGLHELPEHNAERIRYEAIVDKFEDQIRHFSKRLLGGGGRVAEHFRREVDDLFDRKNNDRFKPGFLSRHNGVIRNLVEVLDGWPGIRLDPDGGCFVETEAAGRFLRGRWLEAYLFLMLRSRYAGWNGVEVATGVRLQYLSSTTHVAELGELDVAVMIGGQLHAIEAKTGTLSSRLQSGKFEQSVAKVEQLKRKLMSQHGQYMICATAEDASSVRHGDFGKRCADAGIALFLGPIAPEQAVDAMFHQK
jgi:hypothetical protein